MKTGEVLVELNDICEYFSVGKKKLKALDGINLVIHSGEVLGIVGESGCGKSTLGRVISRIYHPTKGQVVYKGMVSNVPRREEKEHRLTEKQKKEYCKNVQVIFQDPYSSLNPRHTTRKSIIRGMEVHNLYPGHQEERMKELLQMVGLPESAADRYPHEFSGGQRQRICIARALSIEPELLICDEPISALDVSIQSQIVNLLISLKERLGLTMVFISHDLSVVKYICDRVVVMYLGTVMEVADSQELYRNPLHFYTKALLSAVPIADPEVEKKRHRILLNGDIPSPVDAPKGCTFCSRCPYADEKKKKERPALKEVSPGHLVSCHHLDRIEKEETKEGAYVTV